MVKVIINKGLKYYYYDDFRTWEKAYKIAQRYKNKRKEKSELGKVKYFILPYEGGWIIPQTKYRLYLTKIMRIMG